MPRILLLTIALVACVSGCGTIKGRTATEQLLVSDAVDQSIDQIDFAQLAGEDVYLDSKYMKTIRGIGFVNADYIVSSLRQSMISANCRLHDTRDDAKYIVEVRVGALGSDCHEVNYGVPGSQALNQTAALVTSAPIPAGPEISLARTDACRAAAKISLFAYERESRAPIWESGTAQGVSLAKSTWILGAGPFEKGNIYEDSRMLQTELLELPEVPRTNLVQPMIAMFHRLSPRRTLQNKLTPPSTQLVPVAVATSTPLPGPGFAAPPALRPVPINEFMTPSISGDILQASASEPIVEN